MWFWAVPLNVDMKFKWEFEARFDACDSLMQLDLYIPTGVISERGAFETLKFKLEALLIALAVDWVMSDVLTKKGLWA